ncbi:MAG: hypothetical protein CVT67_12070 [Actinobacteria bacterium HGW-Actinobacteria-7]|nr:MAG: hypothetical protein CVT67_12070 [Actinobacteria bacterium HGW-Actinobacteria-7]
MKYRLIDEEKSRHTISRLCRALGVTRAGYYAHKTRPTSRRSLQDAHLKELIEKAFADSHRAYGAPRIHAELLLANGVHVSRKRVARLMRELDIIGVSRRKAKGRRRKLAPETAAAPDLVKRDFSAKAPNELWVADITYVPTWEGWLFLAVVTDCSPSESSAGRCETTSPQTSWSMLWAWRPPCSVRDQISCTTRIEGPSTALWLWARHFATPASCSRWVHAATPSDLRTNGAPKGIRILIVLVTIGTRWDSLVRRSCRESQ